MFGSAMLDIAIGVVFVFLLLSVFATTINELIFSLLSMRGKELLSGIQTLLNNDPGLVSRVYNHGQVFGLFKGDFNPAKPGNLPSYIPSRNFALALIDSVKELAAAPQQQQPAGQAAMNAPAPQQQQPPAQPGDAAQSAAPPPDPQQAANQQQPVNQAAMNAPPPQQQQPPVQPQDPAQGVASVPAPQPAAQQPVAQAAIQGQTIVKVTQEFKDAAQRLAQLNPKIGKPLVSMIEMAQDDATKVQQSVEEWFNSGMDRVSGWYKYKTQWCLFWIGLVIAVTINADTIHIVKQLSSDSTLRQTIVAAAQSANQAHNSANPPAGNNNQPAPPSPADQNATPNSAPDITKQIDAVQKSFGNLNGLGVPLGWPQDPNDKRTLGTRFVDCITWVFTQPSMMLGWLLSAIAISLGAPFWFDALNKIMIIRSTIKPGEKSPDGKPKDKSQP